METTATTAPSPVSLTIVNPESTNVLEVFGIPKDKGDEISAQLTSIVEATNDKSEMIKKISDLAQTKEELAVFCFLTGEGVARASNPLAALFGGMSGGNTNSNPLASLLGSIGKGGSQDNDDDMNALLGGGSDDDLDQE